MLKMLLHCTQDLDPNYFWKKTLPVFTQKWLASPLDLWIIYMVYHIKTSEVDLLKVWITWNMPEPSWSWQYFNASLTYPLLATLAKTGKAIVSKSIRWNMSGIILCNKVLNTECITQPDSFSYFILIYFWTKNRDKWPIVILANRMI